MLGQGSLVEQGMFVQTAASLQNPQPQWPVALQVEFGVAVQAAGHCPLVLKHGAPGHSQHTGGRTQSHFPGPVSWHCAPAGALGGHVPTHPTTVWKWQMMVVDVVLVLVLVVVVVFWMLVDVVLVEFPTTCLSAGTHRICGLPTGTLSSWPNWVLRLTRMVLAGKLARVAQLPFGHVFALIL